MHASYKPAALRSHVSPTVNLSRQTFSLFVFSYLIGLVMLMTAGLYDGPLAEPSLLIVLGCLVLLLVQFGYLLSGKRFIRTSSAHRGLLLVPPALAVFCIATFADRRLLIDSQRPPQVIRVIQLLELALLASYVPSLWRGYPESSRWKITRFSLFALFLVVGGMSVFQLSPAPHIDVWHLHDAGAKVLLDGRNPYVDVHVEMTSPDKPQLAFVYPPTTCYLSAIAYVLGGDVRWGILIALLVSGISMRALTRAPASRKLPTERSALLEDAPALLLWLTPKTFFFLEQAWNDVYGLVFVALALVAHAHGKRYSAAVCLGLALSAKQTMIWLLPPALLLGFNAGQWSTLLGVAAATVIPFLVADFWAFKHWVLDVQANFRIEPRTISVLSYLYRHFGIALGRAPGFVLAISCALLTIWRAPHTRYAFTVATTLTIFVFFLFNVLMCMNYYFLIASLALLGAAVSIGDEQHADAKGVSLAEGGFTSAARSGP